jgi:glucosamine-6-phosphate isomerase
MERKIFSTMKLIVADSYEEMSRQACQDLIDAVQGIEFPLICPASGDSPAGLYRELVLRYRQNNLPVAGWSFVGLDEWVGMNESDEGSCKFHLNNQLFRPLQIKEDRICFFDGRQKNLELECTRAEKFIQTKGGIDLAIVGLGLNGHVGMNEPDTIPSLRTHVSAIDPETQQIGQKYFTEKKTLTKGITLGIANILASKHIYLLVSGSRKAGIVKKVIEGDITGKVPASFLRRHEGLRIYLDSAAASLLDS